MSSYVGAGAALSWFSSVGGPTGTIGSTGAGPRSGGTISQMIVTLSCTQMHVSESCSEVAAFNRSLPLTIFACPVAVSAIHSWMAVSVMFANARCANITDTAIQLWIADTATGQAKMVSGSDRLNAATSEQDSDTCIWVHDNVTIICEIVPPDRGPAPVEPIVPVGPPTLENHDKDAPAPTYEDMIRTPFDETLFEYYFASQLAAVDTSTGRRTLVGRPAIFESVSPAPNGEYVLVSKVKRPYSHLIPFDGFPQDVEIWNRRGAGPRKV